MSDKALEFAFEEYRALREEIIVHFTALDRIVSRTVVLVGSIYLLAIATKLTVPGMGSFSVSPEAGLIASLVPIAIVYVARRNFEAIVQVTREIGKYLTEIEAYAYSYCPAEKQLKAPKGWETTIRDPKWPWPDPEQQRSKFWSGFQIFTVLVSGILLTGLVIDLV